MRPQLTAADDSYTHQLVAPSIVTDHCVPTWAERTYHVLFVEDDLMFQAGRAVYPYAGRRTAFGSVTTRDAASAVREKEEFELGSDPNRGELGPLVIEIVKPMEEVRLRLAGDDIPISYDLTFRARHAAVQSDRNVIELKGELVTDYMNFYQSGFYDGTISIEGIEYQVDGRPGFRDRGWGTRKHEGSPRRGFVLFAALEFPESSLFLLLYETASGRRVFTNGWSVDENGVRDVVTGIEHRLTLDEIGLVTGGVLELDFESAGRQELTFEVRAQDFLAVGGYHAEQDRIPLGFTAYDLHDPETLDLLNSQNNHGCVCELAGVAGQGFFETGIGAHHLYKPQLLEPGSGS